MSVIKEKIIYYFNKIIPLRCGNCNSRLTINSDGVVTCKHCREEISRQDRVINSRWTKGLPPEGTRCVVRLEQQYGSDYYEVIEYHKRNFDKDFWNIKAWMEI